MSDAGNQAAWSSVIDGLVFNPETATCAKWLELKSYGTFIGVPEVQATTDESWRAPLPPTLYSTRARPENCGVKLICAVVPVWALALTAENACWAYTGP